jgi:hypothetical protein
MRTYRITWMVIIALSAIGIPIALMSPDPKMALVFLVPLLGGPYAIWSTKDKA